MHLSIVERLCWAKHVFPECCFRKKGKKALNYNLRQNICLNSKLSVHNPKICGQFSFWAIFFCFLLLHLKKCIWSWQLKFLKWFYSPTYINFPNSVEFGKINIYKNHIPVISTDNKLKHVTNIPADNNFFFLSTQTLKFILLYVNNFLLILVENLHASESDYLEIGSHSNVFSSVPEKSLQRSTCRRTICTCPHVVLNNVSFYI